MGKESEKRGEIQIDRFIEIYRDIKLINFAV